MTARFTAARRAAFFRALAATGNQTLAAERAKVSRSWVSLHRAGDPAFRAAMEAAIAQARASIGGRAREAGDQEAAARARWHDGAELVVRGTNGRRTQVARARVRQWSPRAETRFLATLSATCNVKAACAEVGMTAASAYAHRHRWPAFAERWDEAIETGYINLEMALIEAAANPMTRLRDEQGAPVGWRWDPPARPDDPHIEIRGMTTEQAIHLLHMHKNEVHGIGKRSGRHRRTRPGEMDELRQSILRKIEAIARGRERERAKREAAFMW